MIKFRKILCSIILLSLFGVGSAVAATSSTGSASSNGKCVDRLRSAYDEMVKNAEDDYDNTVVEPDDYSLQGCLDGILGSGGFDLGIPTGDIFGALQKQACQAIRSKIRSVLSGMDTGFNYSAFGIKVGGKASPSGNVLKTIGSGQGEIFNIHDTTNNTSQGIVDGFWQYFNK